MGIIQVFGKLIIEDYETGINPDNLLYKIIDYDANIESGESGRDILFYGTRYSKYIEEYNSLLTSYEDLEAQISDLKALGSGDDELVLLNSRLNNIEADIIELNNDNRDFNDGTRPYSDEEPNIAIYVGDYAGNTNKYIGGISRKVLMNSNLIDFEAKPLENSTFSIVKTSQYTKADKVNLRIRSQGATNMLITMDPTVSPMDLLNYGTYESSNGEYEFDISTARESKVTIYAYFTAGEYDNGNLIYNSFSDTIYIDEDAPTEDAPEVKISNTFELKIKSNQKDLGSGISKVLYGYSKSEDVDSFEWYESVNEIERLINPGEKYYIRTKAIDVLENGPTISEYTILQCPTEKIVAVPNVPKIGNMKAITWNNNLEEIEINPTTLKDADNITRVWYNYEMGNGIDDEGSSKWANAKSSDGSYWVWIPRYAYRVVYYTDSTKNEIKGYYQRSPYTGIEGYFLSDGETISTESAVKTNYGNIDVVFLYGAEDDRYLDLETNQLKSLIKGGSKLYNEYIVHPAFKAASIGVNTLGTWGDNNLTGIWVAKFEASRDDADYLNEGTSEVIKVVPSVRSIDNVSVGKAYDYSISLNPTMKSHLMKNSEWGAVTYLAYSDYGRNGHAISQNLSSDMITGGGTTSSGATYATSVKATFEERYSYKTTAGFKSSTTNNIYGIYDLAGGAEEYVASYINNGKINSSYASSLQNAEIGCAQLYTGATTDTNSSNYSANQNVYGDAIYEISLNGTKTWQNNDINYPSGNEVIFVRGGSYNTDFGMFNVNKSSGIETVGISFRPVLAP